MAPSAETGHTLPAKACKHHCFPLVIGVAVLGGQHIAGVNNA